MEIRDLKYLLAYIIPLFTLVSISIGGIFSFSTVIIAFILIPVIELFTKTDPVNLSESQIENKITSKYFDFLLYANVIWVYGNLVYFGLVMQQDTHTKTEILGMVLSMGIMFGSNGINVAHELGHKSGFWPQTVAKLLLLPNLYMHFIIEHNYGHHLKVATPEDPATSRYKENIFSFWIRSVSMSIVSAWNIEINRLKKANKPIWSFNNNMLLFTIIQFTYIVIIMIIFSPFTAMLLIFSGLIGVLLLESINYIEHYGLVRRILPSGRYEKVETFHSWNSDHEAGRILLYELTRHSDHHYKASKKYQLLNHYDESPQLPYGYPTSILIALCPPLWFRIMNPRVNQWRKVYLEGH